MESVAIPSPFPSTPGFASRARLILPQAVGPIGGGAVGNPPKLKDPLGGQEPLLRIAVACVEVKPGSTQAANRGRVQMCGLLEWEWQGKVSWALAWAMWVTRR